MMIVLIVVSVIFILIFIYFTINRITDIVDCLSSAASVHGQSLGLLSVFSSQDQMISNMKQPPDALTIIVRSQQIGQAPANPDLPRVVSLKLLHREDRNFLLAALRTLIGTSGMPDATASSPVKSIQVGAISVKQKEVQ